jgi:tRNA nucleotidyltransferase/poly(A) polymerase
VVAQLRDAGFEAYWAGGCVRDDLLGRTPKDFDVATSAMPNEVREVFGKRHTLAIGAAFGVIAVIGSRESGNVDVTTFRLDAAYTDGRHPDAVTFGTVEQDAERRDFTINGLYYDPIERHVLDLVAGRADLEARLIRAIGNPRERLAEDKLRMLRAVRFAAELEFSLDAGTVDAVREMAEQIVLVSPERIAQELQRLLVAPGRRKGLELLRETGLLEPLLPEAELLGDASWNDVLDVVEKLEAPTFPLALAAVLADSHPGDDGMSHEQAERMASDVATRWRLSNQHRERVAWLLEHEHALVGAQARRWSQLQPILIHPGAVELLRWHEAKNHAAGQSDADGPYCRERLARRTEELNPPPLVTGDDLIAHGIPRGKSYARLLQAVRDAQLDGEVSTTEEALALVDRLRMEK